jgi:hypothetical protein
MTSFEEHPAFVLGARVVDVDPKDELTRLLSRLGGGMVRLKPEAAGTTDPRRVARPSRGTPRSRRSAADSPR